MIKAESFASFSRKGRRPDAVLRTGFNVGLHGFAFGNDVFTDYNGIPYKGRCIGMVYAALDYQRSGMAIPPDTGRPADGTILADFIMRRHVEGNRATTARCNGILASPRQQAHFDAGLKSGSEFARLRAYLDGGQSIPLTLVPGNGVFSHAVLAIGYEIPDDSTEAVKISLYDPNLPGAAVTLVAGSDMKYTVVRSDGWPESRYDRFRFRAYFPHDGYAARWPEVAAVRRVALKASNGKFVAAEAGGGRELVADRGQQGAWETFGIEEQQDRRVALRAASGQYVAAEDGGGGDVNANRGAVGAWERFRCIAVFGRTAFQTANGRFLSVGRDNRVRADAFAPGLNQAFELVGLD